jgi:hypothetical protein
MQEAFFAGNMTMVPITKVWRAQDSEEIATQWDDCDAVMGTDRERMKQ